MCVCAVLPVYLYIHVVCVSLYIYIEYVRVCLRLDIGHAMLIRLACVCEYGCVCVSVCVYHVEHQDKRIRRGVRVRAGGSQGRRELQAAADTELVTEKHVHAVYSSVLIWLDSAPPSASAFISGS